MKCKFTIEKIEVSEETVEFECEDELEARVYIQNYIKERTTKNAKVRLVKPYDVIHE